MVLWHGTVSAAANDIEANGINLGAGRPNLDFGRGFYTTTRRRQAEDWARTKWSFLSRDERAAAPPVLLRFQVPLDLLAPLDSLMFVRGDPRHDSFWSLICHCRSSTAALPRTHLHPGRVAPNDWYDVVCGPVAASWPPDERLAIPGFDQFSFHTVAGVGVLNDLINAGPPEFQRIDV